MLRFQAFGAMLVEHLLCKVRQWHQIDKDRMSNICDEVPEKSNWQQGENDNNAMCFPFPQGSTSKGLEKVLEE
jgi:hypothetical protein